MRILHDALRPPDGYELEIAVGTTFTLDLVSLLSIPLAVANLPDRDGGPVQADPLELLASLERSIDRITIFHQAGVIRVPERHRELLTLVESSLASVNLSRGRLFHPKVWIARYSKTGGSIRHRVVVLSRNLTPDRGWDTVVVLEGDQGGSASADSKPVGDFVRWLAARPDLPRERRSRIDDLSGSVARARFKPPQPFATVRFQPLGIPRYTTSPVFTARRVRILVVAPFIGSDELRRLSSGTSGSILVTRPEELARLGESGPGPFASVLQLDEGLESEPSEDDDAANALVGLHAKLYCADQGKRATVWTGSSNATTAGFGSNVEFMVEMEGTKGSCGVDAILGGEAPGTFSSMLRPIDEVPEKVEDDDAERRLDAIAALVAGLPIEVTAENDDPGWRLVLRLTEPASVPEGVDVRVTPLAASIRPQPLELDHSPVAEFAGLEPYEVSGLFVVELAVSDPRAERAFVARWPLIGDAPDRMRALLGRLVTDRERLVAFLRLLLGTGSGPGFPPSPGKTSGDGTAQWGGAGTGTPLFELLLKTLASQPERLDSIARWISELAAAAGGDAETELLAIWEPIWLARMEQQ